MCEGKSRVITHLLSVNVRAEGTASTVPIPYARTKSVSIAQIICKILVNLERPNACIKDHKKPGGLS